MRKSRKRILSQAMAVMLSVSMTTPSMVVMANPIDDSNVQQETVVEEGTTDPSNVEEPETEGAGTVEETEKETETESEQESESESEPESEQESESETEAETETETEKETEDDLKDIEIPAEGGVTETTQAETKEETLTEKITDVIENVIGSDDETSYPKFGSDEFILWWFDEATEEQKQAWYDSISEYEEAELATASNAKYPSYTSSEFDDWFNEKAVKSSTRTYDLGGEEVEMPELDLDVLAKWIKEQSQTDAFSFIDSVLGNFYAVLSGSEAKTLSLTSSIGSLWPETWGDGADYMSDGDGTQDSPYILDSKEDLRAFAKNVAAGAHEGEAYFLLKKGTYDLNGSWIPVGFNLNADGEYVPFTGHFAGEDGAVIKNLGFKAGAGLTESVAASIRAQKYTGFFGEINGATINNIQIQTSGCLETSAVAAGILAGKATDCVIRDVEITGKVKGTTFVGGLVGVAESSSSDVDARDMIIEDVTCTNVAAYSNTAVSLESEGVEGHGAIGGVVGHATNASILDVTVSTNTDAGNHIYGKSAFVGGIVGVMTNSDVLNSYVSKGTIGSSDAFAVGGLVGGYENGGLKVGRFGGEITKPSSTNNYSACFIGYRVNGAGFTYGEKGDIAYLFTDSKNKADTGICGSRIEDDGIYDSDAWIGYWHSEDSYCTIVSGDNADTTEDRFYQILEDGILNAKKDTSGGNGYENTDTINHYTADKSGNPTRGYLLTIENPIVNSVQAAEITAYVNGSYKETVTADNLGAFAPGDQVYISFTDLKDGNGYFRMDDDADPCAWYSYYKGGNTFFTYDNYDEGQEPVKTALSDQGGWSLTMPSSDAVVSAAYEQVAEAVTTNPTKVTFEVTQIRTGDRSNPTTKWEVTAKDSNGAVITDAKGSNWDAIDPTNGATDKALYTKFWIGSLVNGAENNKYNLTWTTSNTADNNIISKPTADSGLTTSKNAYVTLNLTDSAINTQIGELVKAQHDAGDKDSITTKSPYYYHAVITAVADTGDVADKENPPKGYCDITIKLNIKDETDAKIDSVSLSKNEITYNVVRTLSGDRSNPKVTYSVNGEDASATTNLNTLTATFNPDYFSKNSVNWYISNEADASTGVDADSSTTKDGTIEVAISSSDTSGYRIANVTLKGVTETEADNSFISAQVKTDTTAYTSQMKKVPDTTYTYDKYVKVTAKDSVNNSVTDTCHVTLTFKTVDETEIMPTKVEINKKSNVNGYNIVYDFKSDSKSDIKTRIIRKADAANTLVTDGVGEKLAATVYSGSKVYDSSKDEYKPYDDTITWELSVTDATSTLNPYDVLNIDKTTGQITVRGYNADNSGNGYSPWVASLISEGKLNGTTVNVRVIARSVRDNSVTDYVDIPVTFTAASMAQDQADLTYDLIYTKTAGHSVANAGITEAGTWSGNIGKSVSATATGTSEAPIFYLTPTDLAEITQNSTGTKTVATITPETDIQWIKDVISGRAKANTGVKTAVLSSKTANGTPLAESDVTINFRYDGVDMTASVPTSVNLSATKDGSYDTSMASVKDRDITMSVTATQGNYSQDNPGTRTWKYGIVELHDTTYSSEGVKTDDATYKITGDLADYATVQDGYLVPTKGLWEDTVINKNLTKGTVTGVVTASKDCSGVTVTDSYAVTLNFRYDKTVVDQHEAEFNVVYTETSRTNEKNSTWAGDDYIQLYAQISDDSGKDVTPQWVSSDTDIVTVDSDGRVYVNKATWINEIIEAARNDYDNEVHTGTKTATVTAKHPTTGATADTCTITVNFRYDQLIMDHNTDTFTVVQTQTSRTINPSSKWSGDETANVDTKIYVAPGSSSNVNWSSENSQIVTVDDEGNIKPVVNADWMKQIVSAGKYTGKKTVAVNAENDAKTVRDSNNVTVNFIYEDVEMAANDKTMDITITATGTSSNPTYTVTGTTSTALSAAIHSKDASETAIKWSSADAGLLSVAGGKVALVLPTTTNSKGETVQAQGSTFKSNAHSLIREALGHSWTSSNNYITTGTIVITASSEDGRMADQCRVKVNLKYLNNTTTTSSGGGGGGGGGSSLGRSSSSTMGLTINTTSPKIYSSSNAGEWVQDANGWQYKLTSTGKAISGSMSTDNQGNPVAGVIWLYYNNKWYIFGVDGYLDTGWVKDTATGNWYYCDVNNGVQTGWHHDTQDNYWYYLDTRTGVMLTGWQQIGGKWYYFATTDAGTWYYNQALAKWLYIQGTTTYPLGAMYANTMTPDGYKVGADGVWTQE